MKIKIPNPIMAGILPALVLLGLTFVFLILAIRWYSFWLFLFFIFCMSFWLMMYGFFWADVLTWTLLVSRSFVSTFLISFLFVRHLDPFLLHLAFSLVTALLAVFVVTLGYGCRKIPRNLLPHLFSRRIPWQRSKQEQQIQEKKRGTSVGS